MTARNELPYLAWAAGAALFGAAAGLLAWEAERLSRNVGSFKSDLREEGLRDVLASQNEIRMAINGFSHGVKQASTDVDRLRHDVMLLQRLVAVPQPSASSRTVLWATAVVSLVFAIAVFSLPVPSPLNLLAGGTLLFVAGGCAALGFNIPNYVQQKRQKEEPAGKSQQSGPRTTP